MQINRNPPVAVFLWLPAPLGKIALRVQQKTAKKS